MYVTLNRQHTYWFSLAISTINFDYVYFSIWLMQKNFRSCIHEKKIYIYSLLKGNFFKKDNKFQFFSFWKYLTRFYSRLFYLQMLLSLLFLILLFVLQGKLYIGSPIGNNANWRMFGAQVFFSKQYLLPPQVS